MGQKLDKHGLERFAAVCGHASGRRQGAGARRVGGTRRPGAMEAIGRARDRRETGRAGVAVPDRVDDEAHHGRCDAGSGPRGTRRTGRAGRPAAAGAREPPGAASGGRPARGHAARRGSCDGAGVADVDVRVRDGHGALASMQRGRAQLPVGSFATAGTARPERDDGVPARAGTRLRTWHRASAEGLTADAGDHVVHAPAPVPQIGDVHRGPRAVLPVRPIAEAKAALFTALGQPADLLAVARRMLTRRSERTRNCWSRSVGRATRPGSPTRSGPGRGQTAATGRSCAAACPRAADRGAGTTPTAARQHGASPRPHAAQPGQDGHGGHSDRWTVSSRAERKGEL